MRGSPLPILCSILYSLIRYALTLQTLSTFGFPSDTQRSSPFSHYPLSLFLVPFSLLAPSSYLHLFVKAVSCTQRLISPYSDHDQLTNVLHSRQCAGWNSSSGSVASVVGVGRAPSCSCCSSSISPAAAEEPLLRFLSRQRGLLFLGSLNSKTSAWFTAMFITNMARNWLAYVSCRWQSRQSVVIHAGQLRICASG